MEKQPISNKKIKIATSNGIDIEIQGHESPPTNLFLYKTQIPSKSQPSSYECPNQFITERQKLQNTINLAILEKKKSQTNKLVRTTRKNSSDTKNNHEFETIVVDEELGSALINLSRNKPTTRAPPPPIPTNSTSTSRKWTNVAPSVEKLDSSNRTNLTRSKTHPDEQQIFFTARYGNYKPENVQKYKRRAGTCSIRTNAEL